MGTSGLRRRKGAFLDLGGKPWKVLLLDLDGTLFPEASRDLLTALENRLRGLTCFPEGFLKPYFQSVLAFPAAGALEFLLSSLGLSTHTQELAELLQSWEVTGLSEQEVAALADLRETCLSQQMEVRFFSSAGKNPRRFAGLKALFPEAEILTPRGGSKADPKAYGTLMGEIPGTPADWILCDDVPLALWTAKRAGLSTVWRKSSLFSDQEARIYRSALDFEVNDLRELIEIIRVP